MAISSVQKLDDPLTNQRVLNEGNAKHLDKMLASNAHTNVLFMTLRPNMYEERENEDKELEVILFKKKGSQAKFMVMLEAWNEKVGVMAKTLVEDVHRFMNNVTWEPVDMQHILYTCTSVVAEERQTTT